MALEQTHPTFLISSSWNKGINEMTFLSAENRKLSESRGDINWAFKDCLVLNSCLCSLITHFQESSQFLQIHRNPKLAQSFAYVYCTSVLQDVVQWQTTTVFMPFLHKLANKNSKGGARKDTWILKHWPFLIWAVLQWWHTYMALHLFSKKLIYWSISMINV